MTALAWVLGLGIFVALLLWKPRRMAILVGIVMGLAAILGGGFWAYLTYDQWQRDRLAAQIETTIRIDTKLCSDADYPLFVGFVNHSTKTVQNVSFEASGYRDGYSDPLYRTPYASYSTDRIMLPGKGMGSCWRVPEKAYGVDDTTLAQNQPATLIWRVTQVLPTFE